MIQSNNQRSIVCSLRPRSEDHLAHPITSCYAMSSWSFLCVLLTSSTGSRAAQAPATKRLKWYSNKCLLDIQNLHGKSSEMASSGRIHPTMCCKPTWTSSSACTTIFFLNLLVTKDSRMLKSSYVDSWISI